MIKGMEGSSTRDQVSSLCRKVVANSPEATTIPNPVQMMDMLDPVAIELTASMEWIATEDIANLNPKRTGSLLRASYSTRQGLKILLGLNRINIHQSPVLQTSKKLAPGMADVPMVQDIIVLLGYALLMESAQPMMTATTHQITWVQVYVASPNEFASVGFARIIFVMLLIVP